MIQLHVMPPRTLLNRLLVCKNRCVIRISLLVALLQLSLELIARLYERPQPIELLLLAAQLLLHLDGQLLLLQHGRTK